MCLHLYHIKGTVLKKLWLNHQQLKGIMSFLSPLQNLEEIILELNGYEKKVLSKMDDWSNESTSTFPMSLAGL